MRCLFISIIFFLSFSCTNKDKTPSGILPREKMEKVLWDMIEADRFATHYISRDTLLKDAKIESFKMYERVFALHKISKNSFIKSYTYYLSRPDLAKVIFDSVSAKANRKRSELYMNSKFDSSR